MMRVAATFVVVGAALGSTLGGASTEATSDDSAQADREGHVSPRAVATGPLTYFNNQCARCHGEYGVFGGVPFFPAPADDAALVHEVEEMVAGPAAERVKGAALDALVAYHRAISLGEPFIAVTRVEQEELGGESAPDAEVVVVFGGERIRADRDGHEWSVEGPAGFDISARRAEVIVIAERGDIRTELALDDGAFSHREKIEALRRKKRSDSSG